MESVLKRYKRYFRYLYEWIFYEKLYGLDFMMRDMSLIKKSNGVFHGYSKTDERHCKDIIDNVFSRGANKEVSWRLLDIGCGKGAFLREAAKYPFEKVDGIELEKHLAERAEQNFRILKMSQRVNIYCEDATQFADYGNYNVFYFFNPFDKPIMEQVAGKIFEECQGEFLIVLHNPVCADVVEAHGGIRIKELFDEVKSYKTYLYRCEA